MAEGLDPYSPEGCFIATAAYGTETHPRIDILREFRDQKMKKYYAGRILVRIYYRLSPPVARYIEKSKSRKEKVRKFLVKPLCDIIQKNVSIP